MSNLNEIEQMRIDFVANVSHEIRTPLTSIKGFADTILSDLKNGRKINEELVEPIIRNCERLENITKDLLDLSTLDAMHGINKENFSLPDVTGKIFKTLEDKFTKRAQTAKWKCSCFELYGDIHRVEQVLTNLLDNASKYTPVGGNIEAHWFDEKNKIVLEVRDNGAGIGQEHLPRLFERFYRVDKGRSRNLGGTGLGLAIVKHIMLAHNGTVSVTSELGFGSVFRCEFS
jgi:two-component system phosphate regulon sensor histidine kinase PhoR